MACCASFSPCEEQSPVRFVYYKVRFTLDGGKQKDVDFLAGLRNSYAEYLNELHDGVHGYGRFFLPGKVIRRQATGHFAFIVNEFKDQERILNSLREITQYMSSGESFAYEISERQFIDDISQCGKGTACVGWKYVKKEVFGPKDNDNWFLFTRQMNFLKECVGRTSQW